ncbi:ribokinase [Bacillus sp. T33-2]|uniref:ribokinase n=1 Tax=Bacillus sp. T33-2 TaxID=2054168 RepID=UPI000C780F38|nr:ribokinase [Bacillus sp. T33-2]PLR89142.1 ribokinase [Bacillus sp. T33-2]
MKKIAVVGSVNIDYFVESDVLPQVGETVLGRQFFTSIGGKGANQAVAAARLGAEVSLFGSVGNDENSKMIKSKMLDERVDITNLNVVAEAHTGAAFVEISKSENRILVIPGANQYTDIPYIDRVLQQLLMHDIILFQLETPLEMLEYTVPKLYEQGKTTILNPAPAQVVPAAILNMITFITPNEHEYSTVFNQHDTSMEKMLGMYPDKLVITCGTKGVKFSDGDSIHHVPTINVDAVDTTGAGDTFSGAFAVALAEGRDLKASIEFGNIAAGLSVRKKGAQTGMPYRPEIDDFISAGFSRG